MWLHECAGSQSQLEPSPLNLSPPTLLRDVLTETVHNVGSMSQSPQTDRSLGSSFLEDAGKDVGHLPY